jgi:hypothetical protein
MLYPPACQVMYWILKDKSILHRCSDPGAQEYLEGALTPGSLGGLQGRYDAKRLKG